MTAGITLRELYTDYTFRDLYISIKAYRDRQQDEWTRDRFFTAAIINSKRPKKSKIKVTDLIKFADEIKNTKAVKMDEATQKKVLERWDQQAAAGIMKYEHLATLEQLKSNV